MKVGAGNLVSVRRRLGALAVVLAVTGCAQESRPIAPGNGGASKAGPLDGRKIFFGRCTRCHTADPLEQHTVVEWRKILEEMAGRTRLSAAEHAALLSFIEQEKDPAAARRGD